MLLSRSCPPPSARRGECGAQRIGGIDIALADVMMEPVQLATPLSQPLHLGFEARDLCFDPVEHGDGREAPPQLQ